MFAHHQRSDVLMLDPAVAAPCSWTASVRMRWAASVVVLEEYCTVAHATKWHAK